MDKNDFITLLQNPNSITVQHTEELEVLLKKYPYFQSARALHLKGLKSQNSNHYNIALKTTAAYTTDRSILFDFITSDIFIQNKISKAIKQNIAYLNDMPVSADDITVNKSTLIDNTLNTQIQETTGVLDPKLFHPKNPSNVKKKGYKLGESEVIQNVPEQHKNEDLSAEELLSIGKPLQFDKFESHSFNEWLKLTKLNPIHRKQEDKTDVNTKDDSDISPVKKDKYKINLVNKFIAEKPKIAPAHSKATKGNLSKVRMIQPETLMTETLARIYVEQKKYKKAIQSFKILSLKYPEKSSFFANQIKAVEQLLEQHKKE